jgi:hypothetical protein
LRSEPPDRKGRTERQARHRNAEADRTRRLDRVTFRYRPARQRLPAVPR